MYMNCIWEACCITEHNVDDVADFCTDGGPQESKVQLCYISFLPNTKNLNRKLLNQAMASETPRLSIYFASTCPSRLDLD